MPRPVLDVALAPFEARHYDGVAAVNNAVFPDHPTTPEELRTDDATWNHEKFLRRRIVALAGDRVVGYAEYGHSVSTFHPRKFWMEGAVRPEDQVQGVGGRLCEEVLASLRALEALEVRAWARESMPESLRFLRRRGFGETMRAWESRLDLDGFDPEAFRPRGPEGVRIVPYAALQDRIPRLEDRVLELFNEVEADVPLPGAFTPLDPEEFRRRQTRRPDFLPEGWFLAQDGDALVGLCALWPHAALEGVLSHGLTGILRPYRRRGLATALKVTALAWAKEAGYREVRTWNDATNEGMLAINRRLGFRPKPAWVTLVKDLEGSRG